MKQFQLWDPGVQPDILNREGSFGNISWDYPQLIENVYEPLHRKYPDYITRQSIGYDTTGEFEMWAYEFTPANYTKTVYLQSGVHAIETDAYFGLARLLTLIAEGTDERLSYIRSNVRLLVVPVVSVWGVSHRTEVMTDEETGESWKIPHWKWHNSLGINANRDFKDQKAKETANVVGYFDRYAKEIDFAIDCHSTCGTSLGSWLLPYANGTAEEMAQKFKAVNLALYEKHPTDIPIKFMGEEKYYPVAGFVNTFTQGFKDTYGIDTLLIEHNDFIYDKLLGTSKTITLAVELYGNHLLQICEDILHA